jgi:hypothetical protein
MFYAYALPIYFTIMSGVFYIVISTDNNTPGALHLG